MRIVGTMLIAFGVAFMIWGMLGMLSKYSYRKGSSLAVWGIVLEVLGNLFYRIE